jgi:hypothetical protein
MTKIAIVRKSATVPNCVANVLVEGRAIPGTDGQLAVVNLTDAGDTDRTWSVTHRPSGFAVVMTDSRERAMALGQLWWTLLTDADRKLAIELGHKLPDGMKVDKGFRGRLSNAAHHMRR